MMCYADNIIWMYHSIIARFIVNDVEQVVITDIKSGI